jgi:Domain of unknown function (DUF4340)
MTPPPIKRRERRLSTNTWILAGGLALLGAYFYFVEVRGGEREEKAQAAITHLLAFSPDAASELVIERPDERIICRKQDGQWRIVTPIRADADDTTINRILSDMAESQVDRTVTAHPRDLATFGLARPLLLTVASGPVRQTIEVGKENPTGNFVFARRRSEPVTGITLSHHHIITSSAPPVLVVDRRIRDAAEKKLYDLREKTILDFSPDDVNAISYTSGSRTVRLVRQPGITDDPQPGWKMLQPLRVRADRGEVERSLNLVSSLRAEQFVSETPTHLERFGLAPPLGSARFNLSGGHTELLLLGHKTTEGALTRYFARKPGSGPVFTINDNLPRDAEQPPEQWREKHVTDFTRADVAELRLIGPSRTLVCAKKTDPNSDDWGVAEFAGKVAEGMNLAAAARMPSAMRADRDRVTDLLAHLGTLEAKSFVDGAKPSYPKFGMTHPALKIVAIDKAGKTLASVSLGARAGDRLYAASPHLGGVFLILAADTDRFRVTSRDLAARS